MLAKSWLVRLPIGTPFLNAFLLSLSRKARRFVAFDNFSQKPAGVCVDYSLFENIEKDVMINAVEEFPHVALKRVAWLRAVLAHGAERSCQIFHTFVRTLTDSARKRGRDKGRLENRIEYLEYRMMQDTISHRCFVNAAQFWIVNQKHSVRSVTIISGTQFATQLEDFVLNVLLKCLHIRPIPLIALENIPRLEQIVYRDYPTV